MAKYRKKPAVIDAIKNEAESLCVSKGGNPTAKAVGGCQPVDPGIFQEIYELVE